MAETASMGGTGEALAGASTPATSPGLMETDVEARDGTPLRVRHWPVPAGDPWASLVLVHGLAEHCGRYDHVGRRLAESGIDTHAFDLRGFGASGGPRASVARWSQIHDDLEDRVTAARQADPSRPLVLYGHSLGGLIALGYALDALDERTRPDVLILSAPAIDARIPLWQRGLIGSLRRIAPNVRLANRIDSTVLCCDPTVGAAYRRDPLNQHQTTARFAAAAFGEQARVAGAIDRLAVPTLVIHGGDDRLVPTETSAVFEGLPGVVRRVYPGLRHEIHNESDSPRIIADVVDFIRARLPSITSAGGPAVPSPSN